MTVFQPPTQQNNQGWNIGIVSEVKLRHQNNNYHFENVLFFAHPKSRLAKLPLDFLKWNCSHGFNGTERQLVWASLENNFRWQWCFFFFWLIWVDGSFSPHLKSFLPSSEKMDPPDENYYVDWHRTWAGFVAAVIYFLFLFIAFVELDFNRALFLPDSSRWTPWGIA